MPGLFGSFLQTRKRKDQAKKKPKVLCKCVQTSFFPVTHCIFDLDGTLLNTAAIYHQIAHDIVAAYGYEYTSEVHRQVLGTSSKETCAIEIQHYKLPISPDDLLERYRSICKERLKNCPLAPGAQRLILHLYTQNVPMIASTTSCKEMMLLKINHLINFFKVFHYILTDDDVLRAIPEPDTYLICASKFPERPSASKCLVFGHSPIGMIAALRAGMQCVMIADRAIPPFAYSPATVVLDSLEDFNPEWFGMTGFQNF